LPFLLILITLISYRL